MVAYSFQKQFVKKIVNGEKAQTIRALRKRHAIPGERMQLYYAQRTKHCRKIISDPICKRVQPIMLSVGRLGFDRIRLQDEYLSPGLMAALAVRDGFDGLEQMHEFWRKNGALGDWSGALIDWHPSAPVTPISDLSLVMAS